MLDSRALDSMEWENEMRQLARNNPPNQEVLFYGYSPGCGPILVGPLASDSESSASPSVISPTPERRSIRKKKCERNISGSFDKI